MPPSVRLPILGLLGEALRDVFGNLGGLARIAWPYYALAALVAVLGFALAQGSPAAQTVAGILGPGTASILTGLAALACTVKWQRHVVLGESLVSIAPINLRVLRYSLWSIAVGLLCASPIVAGGALGVATDLIGPDPTGAAPWRIGVPGILVCLIGLLVGLFLAMRFILVLPAVSADDRPLTPRRSWQLTKGNAFRLLAAVLLLGLGFALLAGTLGLVHAAIAAAAGDEGSIVPSLAEMVLQAAVNLIATMAAASLIARAYRTLAAAAV